MTKVHQLYPPGPRLTLLDGLLLATGRRDLPAFLLQLAQTYGDLVHFEIGSRHAILLNHPDYIRDAVSAYYEYFLKTRPSNDRQFLGDGLLTSENDHHRDRRRLIKPTFHKSQIAAAERVIVDHGIRLRQTWRHRQQIDMMREMKSLALSMTCKTLFDIEIGAAADEIMQAMDSIVSRFSLLGSPLRKLQSLLPISRDRRRHKAQARLDAIVRQIIAERRQRNPRGADLLSELIRAETSNDPENHVADLSVRDETLIFLMAGHETLAMALTWTWYLLAQHPEVEAELHAEIDQVLGDRPPTTADMPKLLYTKMVLSESMRLYPPAWCLVRHVAKDYRVDGYVIPVGSVVILSPYVMHRDSRYFPNASRFDPLRWTAEAKATRPQYSYFPFGGGPRGCIAEALAWTQGILTLACLAQRWQMRLPPAYQAVVNPGIILRPKNGMPMIVERRADIVKRDEV